MPPFPVLSHCFLLKIQDVNPSQLTAPATVPPPFGMPWWTPSVSAIVSRNKLFLKLLWPPQCFVTAIEKSLIQDISLTKAK